MKNYKKPECEFVVLSFEDAITASGFGDQNQWVGISSFGDKLTWEDNIFGDENTWQDDRNS